MFFLQDTVQALYKLFDVSKKLILSDEEKKDLERDNEKSLFEGITIWRDSAAYSTKGQIKFQKIIENESMLPEFLGDLIDLLSFPGYFSVDFIGLMRHEKNLIWQLASQNSGLQLDHDRNFLLLEHPESQKALSKKMRQTPYKQFLEDWFIAHDRISDLTVSGVIPERLLCCIVYYEPTTVSVSELFKL